MSEKLKAVNVIMKGIGRKDAKEAYANFKFQLTSAVVEAFEWPDISNVSEWEPEAPNDEFRCHFIELVPNSSELHAHRVRIEASSIGDFQIQKKQKKEGHNAHKAQKIVIDVICRVRFTSPTALATLESFKVHANKNSEMTIAYDHAPRQGEIDGTRVEMGDVRATEEQRQAALEIPVEPAESAEAKVSRVRGRIRDKEKIQ